MPHKREGVKIEYRRGGKIEYTSSIAKFITMITAG
jgi:hypothetical protein